MRHLKSFKKLSRTSSHRKAMLANLAMSILDKERVTTTLAKAKAVRSLVERLITYGKKGGLHNIRLAEVTIKDKDILKKLFSDIAPFFKDRVGGYTRILKVGERPGDNALLVIIELTGRNVQEIAQQRKRKTRSADVSVPEAPVVAKKEKAAEASEKAEKPKKAASKKKAKAKDFDGAKDLGKK